MSLRAQDNAKMVLVKELEVEIIERAKGFQSGEGVSAFESEANVKEEVTRRAHKAGYVERDGTPRGAGKGDSPRPVNMNKYRENYDKIKW